MITLLVLCFASHGYKKRLGEPNIRRKYGRLLWLWAALVILVPFGIAFKVIPWSFGFWWTIVIMIIYALIDIYYARKLLGTKMENVVDKAAKLDE